MPKKGFGGYRDVHEWKSATFGGREGIKKTWDPTRKEGFAGYASKADWQKATFGKDNDDPKKRGR